MVVPLMGFRPKHTRIRGHIHILIGIRQHWYCRLVVPDKEVTTSHHREDFGLLILCYVDDGFWTAPQFDDQDCPGILDLSGA